MKRERRRDTEVTLRGRGLKTRPRKGNVVLEEQEKLPRGA